MRKPELLAPAGDLERAETAIRYGADAVYLGGQSFSLRSRASNFTLDDIREICQYAGKHHANVHVTVNMIPHDEDFTGLKEYLKKLEEFGVKAVIVASPAIMKIVKETAPHLEIHVSTQMSVTNSQAAVYLHDALHVDRAVLARECTLSDVQEICAKSPVDIEAFIHGGMCVNYSGRCTLSNRMTLRDANRGGCAQSCRWQYHLLDGKEEISGSQLFTMGSKDLCAAMYIPALMEAGVASFKIEGRMKTEYYVASIVSAYRHLIDDIWNNKGTLNQESMQAHLREILKGENRQTWAGFYGSEDGKDSIIYTENSNNNVNHDFLGTIKEYDPDEKTCILEVRNGFDVGETVETLVPNEENHHFKVDEIVDAATNEYLEKVRRPMSLVRIHTPFILHEKDMIRRYRP